MAEYCKDGDKPIVKYSFNGGTQRMFKTKLSPIDIEVKESPVDGSNNSNAEGYGVGFVPGNGNGSFQWFTVTDHKIIQIPTSIPDVYGYLPRIALKLCGQKKFNIIQPSVCNGADLYTGCLATVLIASNLQIDLNRKCPSPDKKRCSILVTHKGKIIYSDQGDCPVSFIVKCGKCEENEIECPSIVYPYYCCHSCAEISAKVRAIKF
jgi:hypothetical protein